MKNSIFLIGFVAILSASCSKSKETPSGLKYTILRAGDGVVAESGKILVVNMTFKDNKDSVWTDTQKNDFPFMMMIQDSVPKGNGIMEVFQVLTAGDSVTFQIPAKQLFEKTFQAPVPPEVDSTGLFTFNIGVTKVITREEAEQMQNDYMAKQNEKAEADKAVQLEKDIAIIDQYLAGKSITAQKTESGLRYVIQKEGKGDLPQPGEMVRVNYTGFTLEGACFDSSIEADARKYNVYNENRKPYEPLQVVLGYQQVIPGWEEALGLMKTGTKMTVYIPSTMAYGAQQRSEVIKANTILTFDMELIEIKKTN